MTVIISICIYLMIGFTLDYLIDSVVPEEQQDQGTDAVIIFLWPIVIIGTMITNIIKKRKNK